MININKEGKRIGWKKCRSSTSISSLDRIVKLEILGSVVGGGDKYNQGNKKKRTSKARVLGVFDLHGNNLGLEPAYSTGYAKDAIKYWKGRIIRPVSPFDRSNNACASGIHFFDSYNGAKNFE